MARKAPARKRAPARKTASRGKKKSASAKKPAAKKAAGAQHIQREVNPWAINIPDHEPRNDSDTYKAARKTMVAIVATLPDLFLGPTTKDQDHHGGGLWVKDNDGWFLIKNLAGMEWSQQFCADPAKVEKLRLFAKRIYAGFSQSIPALQQLGFPAAGAILNKPITTQADISTWCDSIFNASVPLAQPRHTGTVKLKAKGGTPEIEGGVHHYPTPITDVQLFKRDDFQLWVLDDEKQPAAVLPVGHRGSQQSDLRVAFATPGTKLHKQVADAAKTGQFVRVPGAHPMAQQAFAAQNAADQQKAGGTKPQ